MMLMSSQLGSTTRLLDARPIYSARLPAAALCRGCMAEKYRDAGDLAHDNDNMYNFKLFISFRQ